MPRNTYAFGAQAVLETVEFDESAFTKRNPKMLAAQVPCFLGLDAMIQMEPLCLAW